MLQPLLDLLKALTLGKNNDAQLAELKERVAKLEALLEGIQRITSPDGVPGLYIPFRVGIMSEYFLHQPAGQGFSLSNAADCIRAAGRVLYRESDGLQVNAAS